MRREQAPRMSHCPLLKQIKLFSNDKQLKVLLLMSNNQHDIPNLPRCGTTTKKTPLFHTHLERLLEIKSSTRCNGSGRAFVTCGCVGFEFNFGRSRPLVIRRLPESRL